MYTNIHAAGGSTQGGGGDLVPTMPRCACPKVKDMGSFFCFKGVK